MRRPCLYTIDQGQKLPQGNRGKIFTVVEHATVKHLILKIHGRITPKDTYIIVDYDTLYATRTSSSNGYNPYIKIHAAGFVKRRLRDDTSREIINFVSLMARGEQDCSKLPNELDQKDITRIISQLLLCVLINTGNKLVYYDFKPENFLLVRNHENRLDFKLCDLDDWTSLEDKLEKWADTYIGNSLVLTEFMFFISAFTESLGFSFDERDAFENMLEQ